MKKYLIISAILTILISSISYSIVYIPEVNQYFSSLVNKITYVEEKLETEPYIEIHLSNTLPDLSIKSEENFKNIQFGDLKMQLSSDFKLSESSERINLKIDDKNEIEGFYYSLSSTPRKDIVPNEFQSELLKNTYSLAKKSNIPNKFVEDVFKLGSGSEVKDSISGEEITYKVIDIVSSRDNDSLGYYFSSNQENKYKFILLSTKNLYIFNIKVDQGNYLKILKTFYNLEVINKN